MAEQIRRLEADVLVVAGDLTASLDKLEASLAALRGSAKEAVFVPGNHDLWCRQGEPSSRERYDTLVPARARAAGFVALGHGEPPTLFGHRFIGVTGWYDYTLRNRALDHVFTEAHYRAGRFGKLQWSDKYTINWPSASDEGALLDDVGICDAQVRALEAQVDAVADGDEPVVSVTHHLPFIELTTNRGEPPWDFLSGFLGAARLGDALRRVKNLKLSISGHTHFAKDLRVDHPSSPLRALTSPLGYPREYLRSGETLNDRVRSRVTLVEL